jgi:hypothetical protein
MSFGSLAGSTGSIRFIWKNWKGKLGDNLLHSTESKVSQTFMPLFSGGPFTNNRVGRGSGGEGGQQLI